MPSVCQACARYVFCSCLRVLVQAARDKRFPDSRLLVIAVTWNKGKAWRPIRTRILDGRRSAVLVRSTDQGACRYDMSKNGREVMSDLESLRNSLDQLDDRIVETLAERQKLVDQVASCKEIQQRFLKDPSREKQIMDRLTKIGSRYNLDGDFISRVFREVIDFSTRRQEETLSTEKEVSVAPVLVGHLGKPGSYTSVVARRHFRDNKHVTYEGYQDIDSLMVAVSEGRLTHAVVQIENTTAGTLNETYDQLCNLDLKVIGEEILQVEHRLLGVNGATLKGVRRVYSHPQALSQCRHFLRKLSPCEQISVCDTATAAEVVRNIADPTVACIAGADAAELYGLTSIDQDIADQSRNMTRFVVVSREEIVPPDRVHCKTSLVLAVADGHGSLARCLHVLDEQGINLTKLQSRPRPHVPWEYLFYVDLEGRIQDEHVSHALELLLSCTAYLKVFGSYPQRVPVRQDPVQAEQPDVRRPVARVSQKDLEACVSKEQKQYRKASRAIRPQNTVIRVGEVEIGGRLPVVIAGPCSVESREQILESAKMVKSAGAQLLRGGCFKPRTSPYSFQGLKHDGLKLLKEAGERYGLPVVTEVLDPTDVKAVAEYADVLQIGTRNMQNYALLNEVGKVDRPVMLKRGMMATIDEWLAAAEYILVQGNQRVILCERGIRTFETSTRGTLDVAAIPVVRERSHLPIIVDPSHAAGNRKWVNPLALAAIAAGAHGLMVEVHPEPDKALCDGPQALVHDDLVELMDYISPN